MQLDELSKNMYKFVKNKEKFSVKTAKISQFSDISISTLVKNAIYLYTIL